MHIVNTVLTNVLAAAASVAITGCAANSPAPAAPVAVAATTSTAAPTPAQVVASSSPDDIFIEVVYDAGLETGPDNPTTDQALIVLAHTTCTIIGNSSEDQAVALLTGAAGHSHRWSQDEAVKFVGFAEGSYCPTR